MSRRTKTPADYVAALSASAVSIYDPIEVGSKLWIPSRELERILDDALRRFDTAGMPPRTRSKEVKTQVCIALGYPVPPSFKRTRPRFPGQDFDTYVQAANNLQVWNDKITATRRYVLIRPGADGRITRVKVVSGADLALLDRTGALTQKYQARIVHGNARAELISLADTENLRECVSQRPPEHFGESPIDYPNCDSLLPLTEVYRRLCSLLGKTFPDRGAGQERNRGAELHRLVCEVLKYPNYRDDGRFPDVKHQLLEVKLQLEATIDLGLIKPSSEDPLGVPKLGDRTVRHCDVRYALFCGESDGATVRITRFYLTTGSDFFTRFPQCRGKVLNKKLQIPLPRDFFTTETESLPH